jgi:hypothetical protein
VARAGYATKGAIYVILGVLSVRAALDGGAPEGGKGAVQEIGSQPFGQVLLIVTAIGLFAYAAWRAVQAAVDPESAGTDGKGIATRIGWAGSAIAHVSLAVLAIQMVNGGGGDGKSKETWLAQLMSHSGGQIVVAILGLSIIGAALVQLYQAKTTKFTEELDTKEMSPKTESAAVWSGRLGLGARGVVFPVIGFYLVKAAISQNPEQAKSLGEALTEISRSTFGDVMLILISIGLIAYGIYQFVLARYRRIPSPA